jgi:MoxR-like ATPase
MRACRFPPAKESRDDECTHIRKVAQIAAVHTAIKMELGKVIVGQDDVIHQVLTALLSRGPLPVAGGARTR